jgi:Spy/CpxP family protein refolding chaperone
VTPEQKADVRETPTNEFNVRDLPVAANDGACDHTLDENPDRRWQPAFPVSPTYKGDSEMRLGKLVTVMAVSLLLAGAAAAQGPGGFGGGFGGGMTGMLAQSKQLQDELKMDKDQVEKLNQAMAKVRDDLKDDIAKLRDRNLSQEDRAGIFKKVNDANAKAVDSVLKPEQVKRLHQIENQLAANAMFEKEDVQKTLKLSDTQKDKIKGINTDLQKDMRDLFQGGPGGRPGGFDPESAKKRQALQKEATDNILKVLNDDQKAALKDLKGEAFEMARVGFGPGGPGGPGGFGPGGPGGGFGGPPQPGQVLAAPLQEMLKLSADQKKQLEELQKDVDSKLGKILTDEQKKQLKDMREAGGRGGPGGRGPDGPDRPPRPPQ